MTRPIEEAGPGDKLIVEGYGLGSQQRVVSVDRVTKTQIVLLNSIDRYNRRTGRLCGGDAWHSRTLRWPEEGEVQRVQAENWRVRHIEELRRFIASPRFRESVTVPELRVILESVRPVREKVITRKG